MRIIYLVLAIVGAIITSGLLGYLFQYSGAFSSDGYLARHPEPIIVIAMGLAVSLLIWPPFRTAKRYIGNERTRQKWHTNH